jgi:hypothetical protein
MSVYRYFQTRNSIAIRPRVQKKGKDEVVPVPLLTEHQTMKAYWADGGMAPLIL